MQSDYPCFYLETIVLSVGTKQIDEVAVSLCDTYLKLMKLIIPTYLGKVVRYCAQRRWKSIAQSAEDRNSLPLLAIGRGTAY
jgi:hypothetical protein